MQAVEDSMKLDNRSAIVPESEWVDAFLEAIVSQHLPKQVLEATVTIFPQHSNPDH